MDVVRRYVFPLLWMLILGIIAASLAKMAFFPAGDTVAEDDTETPTAEFDQFATVATEKADLSSQMTLPALVQPDPGTALEATTDGEINKIWLAEGDEVAKGERVLQVRFPMEPVDVPVEAPPADLEPAADGEEVAPPAPTAPPETRYRYVTLVATASGTLTGMQVREGDTLSRGDTVATISPGTYSIVAALTPEQQLSLLDLDLVATATLPNSADPVACTSPAITEDTTVEAPTAPAPDPEPVVSGPVTVEGPEEQPGADISAAQLRCPVPAEERVVAGLSVEVTVDLGTRAGVLAVPTTAVVGAGTAGTVYVLDEATGEPVPVEVVLGMRADALVEVVEGLTEGQEVLQFAPGVASDQDEMNGEMW